MSEPREGWALTSSGRSYRKVTGVRLLHPDSWGRFTHYTSNELKRIYIRDFLDAEKFTEEQVIKLALKRVKAAQERAQKQHDSAERDKARLMKRMKELEA